MKVYVGSRLATIIVFGFCLLTIICGSEAEIDPKSIVAIYLFDNDTRDTVVDSSANKYNAEITGKPKWTEGKYGQAIQLDGTTWADVDQKNQADFSLPLFTIAAWVGNMKVAGHQYVLHKSTAGADRNYIVNVQSGTGFFVGGFSPGGTWSPVVSTTNVADGKWHYLTQTYDKKSDKVLVYVDGVLEKERKMGGNPPANEGVFRIGRGPGGSFPFTGCIDEILIARTPFSADQIQKLMKDGLEKSALAVGSSTNQLTVIWGRIKSVR